jgi:hypothetical protein
MEDRPTQGGGIPSQPAGTGRSVSRPGGCHRWGKDTAEHSPASAGVGTPAAPALTLFRYAGVTDLTTRGPNMPEASVDLLTQMVQKVLDAQRESREDVREIKTR